MGSALNPILVIKLLQLLVVILSAVHVGEVRFPSHLFSISLFNLDIMSFLFPPSINMCINHDLFVLMQHCVLSPFLEFLLNIAHVLHVICFLK